MTRERVSVALAFLRGYLAATASSGRTQLPTVRELAGVSGTSRSAMQRAVERLAEEGRLAVRHGSGIERVGDRGARPPPRAPARRWRTEDVCALVERDVLAGLLPAGRRLPSRKELMSRYGVSYRTLRRSLEGLAAEGTLVPEGRSFRVRETRALATQTLYLFAGGVASRRPPAVNTHTLERECARANLELVVVRHNWHGTRMVFDRPIDFTPTQLSRIIGFMVWTMGYSEAACTEVLGMLSRHGKPVGVFDERQGFHQRPIPFANRLTRCAVIAQREDEGASLGRYLLGRGHRRVLYVSPQAGGFSEPRCRGIGMAFERAGYADGVRAVYLPSERPSLQAENLQAVVPGMYETADREMQPGVREALLSALSSQSTSIASHVEQELLRRRLAPVLDQAVHGDGVTAVVGYNDFTAIPALRHLRSSGVTVPEQVSVVGFDDSQESSLEGLTSYNFNSEEAITLLLGHILSHTVGPARSTPAVDLVEGYVTERASSGPAP